MNNKPINRRLTIKELERTMSMVERVNVKKPNQLVIGADVSTERGLVKWCKSHGIKIKRLRRET